MKKRFFLTVALVGLAMNIQADTVKAPSFTEWHDMEVNNVNRLPVHTTFFAFENEELALKGDMTKSRNFLSLHGNWKFNWVENADKARFGSVTSCIYLYVNGQFVGYSEDSKVATEFDITPFVKAGEENLIAFQVFRWCDGSWCEDQDFWRLSGVARDSYLFARDIDLHVDDLRINATLDDNYDKGILDVYVNMPVQKYIIYELLDAEGKKIETRKSPMGGAIFDGLTVKHWTAETPYLYTLVAKVYAKDITKDFQEVVKSKGKVRMKDRLAQAESELSKQEPVEVITQKVVSEKGEPIIKQIPGRLTWNPITLRRGVTDLKDVWDWRQMVVDGKIDDARTNASIIAYSQSMEPVAQWDLTNAWPSQISGPEMASDSTDYMVEEITIVHEGMVRKK